MGQAFLRKIISNWQLQIKSNIKAMFKKMRDTQSNTLLPYHLSCVGSTKQITKCKVFKNGN